MTPPNGFPSYTKIWNSTSTPSISPTRAELSAKGKSIVITGGGTGIGAQIALSFAKAGASFIGLIGRREDKLVSSTAAISAASPDTKVSYATANILNATELDAAFKKFHDEFGEINVLVSNAGFASKITDMLSAELDDWWMGLEVNVKGTFNTIRSFMRHAAPNPILLNITSGIGHLPVIPGVSSYASSKIANAKLVEYAGSEIPGLHVVNVQPGVIETDLNSLAPGLDSGTS